MEAPEGDVDAQTTFAAVGQALTNWERLEDSLSGLYTLFAGVPGGFDEMRAYGDKGKSLPSRLDMIEKQARIYFAKQQRTEFEGVVTEMVAEVKRLAVARHPIAHGIVEAVAHCGPDGEGKWQPPRVRHHLAVSWFAEQRMFTTWPGYGSHEILNIARQFRALEEEVEAFTKRLLDTGTA